MGTSRSRRALLFIGRNGVSAHQQAFALLLILPDRCHTSSSNVAERPLHSFRKHGTGIISRRLQGSSASTAQASASSLHFRSVARFFPFESHPHQNVPCRRLLPSQLPVVYNAADILYRLCRYPCRGCGVPAIVQAYIPVSSHCRPLSCRRADACFVYRLLTGRYCCAMLRTRLAVAD